MKRHIVFCLLFLCLSCVFIILFLTTFLADSYSEKNTIELSATVIGNSIAYSNTAKAQQISLKEYETILLIPADVWEKKSASIENQLYPGAMVDFRAASDSVDEFRGQFICLATSLKINGKQIYDVNEYNRIVREKITPRRILIVSIAAVFLGLSIMHAIFAKKRQKSAMHMGNERID